MNNLTDIKRIEIWKDIKGYEGKYQISNLGQVKSLGNDRSKKEKIRKLNKRKDGYLQVKLWKNGTYKMFKIHQLVAIAFVPNPDNKTDVDHIDTNRSNCHVSNLRWSTHKENCNNPLTLSNKKNNLHLWKLRKTKKYICKNTGEIFESEKEIKEKYNIKGHGNIAKVCRGERNHCGKDPVTGAKLIWRYIED